MIDVVYSNYVDTLHSSHICDYPFSNHKFVLTNCNFKSHKVVSDKLNSRVLNQITLENIKTELKLANFSLINIFENANDRWNAFKPIILNIIDDLSPIKQIRLKYEIICHGLIENVIT